MLNGSWYGSNWWCDVMNCCQQADSEQSTLTREVERLSVVVDLRDAEIAELKQSNAEFQKQVNNVGHSFPAACHFLKIIFFHFMWNTMLRF